MVLTHDRRSGTANDGYIGAQPGAWTSVADVPARIIEPTGAPEVAAIARAP
jgi:hypothetical protein